MRGAAAGREATTDRFEQLFRRHHSAVVAYVRRRGSGESVDDVVGETFRVAWRRLDRVPVEELPWLLGVARNVLATHRRGAIRRRALALRVGSVAAPTATGSEASGGVDAIDDRLLAALAKLSAKDREALTLIAWDGLEPHEAALVLGESPGRFRVRLHRARRRLRRLLEERPLPSHPTSEPRLRMEENHS
ncbi:MAG TPA: sigma-70 family RNA polymerase sigma factor [Solirubrobacteraceae bacterium]|nr:sigma-70 family RNA polymerase sigma factor [Solirubrobacteraceae bacterium]